MDKRVTLAVLLSLCTILPVMGQNKPVDDKDDVVRITTNLVQVDVVVTKDGQPVPHLKAEDFEIYEDGRRQNITSFAFVSNVTSRAVSSAPDKAAADVPPGAPPAPVNPDVPHRTIAIVVDDLGLSVESMTQVRRQLRKFITQGLQVTSLTAADKWNEVPGVGQTKPSPLHDPRPANALMQQRLFLLQQRREGAELLAKKTGGFQVRNSNGFQLDRILEDQRGYYLLGYRPTDETFNRQFHQIAAKVKRAGLSVRTRFGFWGVSEEDAKRAMLSPRDETNLALISSFAKQDLEFELNSFFTNTKTDGSVVRSFIYLDVSDLAFNQVNDRHETSLEIDGVIFGDNGAVEEQSKHSTVLSLRENEYRDALREGLRLRFDIPVKRPGSYQVRLAVRDRTSAKIGSAGQFVDVPGLRSNRLALSGIVVRGSSEEVTQPSVMTTPPARRFTANSDLYFAFLIYHASPNLALETRLYRDGKMVKSLPAVPVDVSKNLEPGGGALTNSSLRLPPDLEPGNYYLQVVVFDKTKDKQAPATQWVQFEIAK
ncbi:MAG TPA: hypothetical protein VJ749_12040 [Pyrinomonadaceae bacterium]|nr:hypothetical protein [Pyrinomonadaceae bacterium]